MTKDKSIFIKNIYYMLAYAFTALEDTGEEEIAAESFGNIHNLFAAILSEGIGRQLKRGLYREYVNREDDLPTARGRIDMPGTIKNRTESRRLLTCEFDGLSENNIPNRILKTTAGLLLRCDDVDARFKVVLKREMPFFSDVDEIDPDGIKWRRVRIQKNNRSYRFLLEVCKFIIDGMLLTTDTGDYGLASFADERGMNRLYEKFILEYYIKEHPEIDASPSIIPWALDGGENSLLPTMRSDITLTNKTGDKVLIIDAKYYSRTTWERYGVRTQRSDNLYQIFAYVKNRDARFGDKTRTVSGMLLYAKTDEEVQPDASYILSGNRISVRTLDLSKEFSLIAKQLDGIVSEYFGIRDA